MRDARGGQATAQVRVTVARPQYDVAVAVIQDERDDKHAHLTARITGYPDQGGVRLEITGQAINAIVGDSLPAGLRQDRRRHLPLRPHRPHRRAP